MAVAGSRGFALFIFIPFSLSLSGTYREVRWSSFNFSPIPSSLLPLSSAIPPSHFHFSSLHHLLPSLLHLVYLSSRPLVLPSFSAVSYFCPPRTRRAFTIHSPYFYGYTGAPRIQLFPFLLPTWAHDRPPLVKTFLVPSAVISAALLVMQFRSRLTLDNKLMG